MKKHFGAGCKPAPAGICTNNLNRAETCLINNARPKVMGFGAGRTMPKTTIGARLYPSYSPGYACLPV